MFDICFIKTIKAVYCDECRASYHLYCLATKLPPEAATAKCPKCKKPIPLPQAEQAVGSGIVCQRKRNKAVIVDSESEEDSERR